MHLLASAVRSESGSAAMKVVTWQKENVLSQIKAQKIQTVTQSKTAQLPSIEFPATSFRTDDKDLVRTFRDGGTSVFHSKTI